jgi:hypothetical protein
MSTIIRRNERSWAISLISDINIMLQNMNLQILRAGGETTISTGRKNMFPDVLLYGDQEQTQILQGWELKLPDTPITDDTFIKDAQRKANSLGLNSCFIWNFTSGVLYVKDDSGHFVIKKQWNDTNHIQSRSDVETYKSDWMAVIQKILLEVNEYLVTDSIRVMDLGEIVSESILAIIIDRNKNLVSEFLQTESTSNAVLGAFIDVWWSEIEDEFISDEVNKFSAYSKVLLLNWTNRIIFAHLIKYRHNAAMEVDGLDFDTSIVEANRVFENITNKCDFYNVFSKMEYNDVIPLDTWYDLMELNSFLKSNGLKRIEQNSLQLILERTVAMAKREVNGQFTTPSMLANLLVQLTVLDWNENGIDPCCGTGSIPKALLDNKKQKIRDVKKCVETTWASDKFSFPLQIANISMTGVDTINIPNRIFQKNVFSLDVGEDIVITNPANGEQLSLELPKFKTIVSNLPFVPFEKITEVDERYINSIISEVKMRTDITLSGRSDYYSYIVFALYKMLENDGRLGIITSNSWLGTNAGREFFSALSMYYRITQLHISNSKRWFNNAQVVTVISIMEKRNNISSPEDGEIIDFCSWNKDLTEIEADNEIQNELVNSSILSREINRNTIALKPYKFKEINELLNLNISLSALFHDISWLLRVKEKLVPIQNVFDVVRGERRGWDKMFYPADGHGIEELYIKKVLKNARKVSSLIAEADSDAFCCSESISNLEELGHYGALSWISKFEHGVNKTGRLLPEVLSKSNMFWYEMKDTNIADIVTTMNPDKRLFFAIFNQPSFINQRLIGLKKKISYPDVEFSHALLNSLIGMFYIEAVGFGRGLGALDINSKTIRNAYMLDPALVSNESKKNIMEKFRPLLERKIYNTELELRKQDRIEFEHEVLKAYGIDEYYEAIESSLLSMQKMRLSVR